MSPPIACATQHVIRKLLYEDIVSSKHELQFKSSHDSVPSVFTCPFNNIIQITQLQKPNLKLVGEGESLK